MTIINLWHLKNLKLRLKNTGRHKDGNQINHLMQFILSSDHFQLRFEIITYDYQTTGYPINYQVFILHHSLIKIMVRKF